MRLAQKRQPKTLYPLKTRRTQCPLIQRLKPLRHHRLSRRHPDRAPNRSIGRNRRLDARPR
jgi:hypothetical protein